MIRKHSVQANKCSIFHQLMTHSLLDKISRCHTVIKIQRSNKNLDAKIGYHEHIYTFLLKTVVHIPVPRTKIVTRKQKTRLFQKTQIWNENAFLNPKICCFFENLAVNYFPFTALDSVDKFSKEQRNSNYKQ